MQTHFTLAQLADPDVAVSEKILRNCVHCGFCTATCPTYLLLGDELDSPRGRIVLIKDMLEHDRPATPEVALHIDRCLSCLSCMTTCPSGVHYMHLVDHARAHVARTYPRPFLDRTLRSLLGKVLPSPARLRASLHAARACMPLLRFVPERLIPPQVAALLAMVPRRAARARASDRPGPRWADGSARGRVGLLAGCVQQVIGPAINEATARALARQGIETVILGGASCCGALNHHLGFSAPARAAAAANIRAWSRAVETGGLEAIVITASGCGTMVKDYGHLFRDDPELAAPAARISAMARDICEYLAARERPEPIRETRLVVAYHAACSLRHGQGVVGAAEALLSAAGYTVRAIPEGHICCGSAGTYNILQPEIADQLLARKAAHIAEVGADLVAAGNIGCMTQIARAVPIPVVHPIELIDWATGGPKPAGLGQGRPTTVS